ncbi:hypothetical protein [Streptomyces camponoticapitis]|nr:hypothetical protein [Streptomyces camponoticapitis]
MREPRQPGPPLTAFWCERVGRALGEELPPVERDRALPHASSRLG